MDRKSFHAEVKNADKGEVTAVFSTLGVKDSDGDVTLPGAFTDGAEVLISAYGHTSWEGALPVGKGRIKMAGDRALLDGQFFLDTTQGRDAFTVVKNLGALGQWSYGYDVLDSEPGVHKGESVRFLKSLKVHEVSPVLIGAGVGVSTVSTKSRSLDPEVPVTKGVIRAHDTAVIPGGYKSLSASDDIQGIESLRDVHAFVDTDADPEVKGSYYHQHHAAPGSPADLRACVIELHRLESSGLSEEQKSGVRAHLSAHLADGDLTPDVKSGTFLAELGAALAVVDSVTARTSEVMAMRAVKNRGLGAEASVYAAWVQESLEQFTRALSTPTEISHAEFLRFIRNSHDI